MRYRSRGQPPIPAGRLPAVPGWRPWAIALAHRISLRYPRFTNQGLNLTARRGPSEPAAAPRAKWPSSAALDWLARHQDDDGRWDGGVARYEDGAPVKGDDSFTVHCPPGETCFGECAYWEADTALTALALLTYLGAGYTHNDGRYAEVVGKGLDFLIEQQKPDGDLRGRSKVVGMYCHAMATLALCEACAAHCR